MMNDSSTPAFLSWVSIFNENGLEDAWNKEPDGLKKITTLFLGFQAECRQLDTILVNKIANYRSKFQEHTWCKQAHRTTLCSKVSHHGKENTGMIYETNEQKRTDNIDSTSPAKMVKMETNVVTSPTFNRSRRKIVSYKKNNKDPRLFALQDETDESRHNQPLKPVAQNIFEEHLLNTPKNTLDDLLETSVVDGTPNPEPLKKVRNKFSNRKTKQKCYFNTPSFSSMVTHLPEEQSKLQIMETTENRLIPQKEETQIGISQILESLDNPSTSLTNCDNGSEKIIILDDDDIPEPNEKLAGLNHIEGLTAFKDNYDRVPETKKDDKNYVYKIDTVRGHERRKLRGWSCKECEKFYEAMNLPQEELEKKMNECSRHRNKFKPDDETFPGFWDLTMLPTPENQKTQKSKINDTSMIFKFFDKDL